MPTAKEKILSVAARKQLRGGAEAVSMRGIASSLGVTATSIYRHFRDKDQLLDAIVDSGFATLLTYLHRRRNPGVLAVTDAFLDFALEQPRLYALMFLRQRERVRVFPADFAAHRSPTFDVLRESVEREIRGGKLRRDNSLEITLTVWSHCHGLISMFTLGRFGDDPAVFRRIFNRSVRRLYRGLES